MNSRESCEMCGAVTVSDQPGGMELSAAVMGYDSGGHSIIIAATASLLLVTVRTSIYRLPFK